MLLFAIWHFSLRGYAYSAWLSTFNEDWTENDKYGLWWKLISFDLWLSHTGDKAQRVGEKAESLLNSLEKEVKMKMSGLVSRWGKQRVERELEEREKGMKTTEDMEFDDGIISRLLSRG